MSDHATYVERKMFRLLPQKMRAPVHPCSTTTQSDPHSQLQHRSHAFAIESSIESGRVPRSLWTPNASWWVCGCTPRQCGCGHHFNDVLAGGERQQHFQLSKKHKAWIAPSGPSEPRAKARPMDRFVDVFSPEPPPEGAPILCPPLAHRPHRSPPILRCPQRPDPHTCTNAVALY